MRRAPPAEERVCSGISDYLHTLANEPSVGLYYVHDHIQRSVPALVASKAELIKVGEQLRGMEHDARLDAADLRSAIDGDTLSTLQNVRALALAAAAKASAGAVAAAARSDR